MESRRKPRVPDEVAETLREVPSAQHHVVRDVFGGDDLGDETELPALLYEGGEGLHEALRGDEEPVETPRGTRRRPSKISTEAGVRRRDRSDFPLFGVQTGNENAEQDQ